MNKKERYRQNALLQQKADEKILGMSWGKATARLNRLILFKLMQKSGHDICYRCLLKITKPEDISRDHIKDWRDHGPEHYWDLDNIAFSHKNCNTNHGRAKGRARAAALRLQKKAI